MLDPLDFLSKLSVPLGIVTTIIGGSAWLTTTHNKVDAIDKDLSSFTVQWQEQRGKLSDQVNAQDSRLSRIEGKLDLLIENMRAWRQNAKNNPSSNRTR